MLALTSRFIANNGFQAITQSCERTFFKEQAIGRIANDESVNCVLPYLHIASIQASDSCQRARGEGGK